MKFVLSLYTQLSANAPAAVFSRALNCILKPVLTHVHNNRDCKLSLQLGAPMVSYLAQDFPEVNLLVSSLARSGSIELFTSALSNTILSLIPHKDRASSVEKTTTLIRKTYGVRATTLWCYGQIWSPSLVAMMRTIGLERVMTSSYNALTQKASAPGCYRMNELGRKVDIVLSDDRFARAVSTYAQNGSSLEELKADLRTIILSSPDDRDIICAVNMDQLCQGAGYNREDDEGLQTVFTTLFDAAAQKGAQVVLARDLEGRGVGYLQAGWYGRDAYAGGLESFHDLFTRNASFRFYLGRYLTLNEFVDESKKDRVLRRRLSDQLSTLPSGSLFLCDTHASALSLAEHRQYYRTVVSVEKSLYENGLCLTSADVDDDGLDEEFCHGRLSSALFSLTGGSVYEYCSKELLVNIFDTVPPWVRTYPSSSKKRSFTDSYIIDGQLWDLQDRVYNLESVNRSRSEFTFSLDAEDLPFTVSKHYRLTNQNLHMSHTIVNRGQKALKATYTTSVYFTLPGATAFAYDERREPLVGSALSGIRNVRFYDSERSMQLSFTSSDSFSVHEENRYQSEVTTLGSQQFYLYTKVRLTFSLDVPAEGAASLNIITRVSSAKERV